MSATATDLIPVRALNQVTYCPRLYYLQYVDAVMPTNEHVEGGLFDHRRVDSPELANKTRKDGDTATSRGIALSSESLGLTGVLDVIEEKHGERYPVETKHGSAPRDDDGRATTWDNDAVQLCAQAMLMEEAFGTPVGRGYQFYAGSRERVEVRFTEPLREQTRAAIARVRELEVLAAPPEPLPAELRHRCFGCSLAPVCLPEETLYQIGHPTPAEAEKPAAGVTRVIPQSDDGAVLYLQEPGSHVGKRSEHLVVRKDGRELSRVPIHAVRQVVVFGHVQVSTQALETLVLNEVPVVYMTGYGRFVGAFSPPPAKPHCGHGGDAVEIADPCDGNVPLALLQCGHGGAVETRFVGEFSPPPANLQCGHGVMPGERATVRGPLPDHSLASIQPASERYRRSLEIGGQLPSQVEAWLPALCPADSHAPSTQPGQAYSIRTQVTALPP